MAPLTHLPMVGIVIAVAWTFPMGGGAAAHVSKNAPGWRRRAGALAALTSQIGYWHDRDAFLRSIALEDSAFMRD